MWVPWVWRWARVWVRAWVSGCLWVRVAVIRGVGVLVGSSSAVRVWWVGVGAELEVEGGGGGGVGDGGVEVDGLADVLGPVVGGGDVVVGWLSGEVADEGDGGWVVGQFVDGLFEGLEDGVHLG